MPDALARRMKACRVRVFFLASITSLAGACGSSSNATSAAAPWTSESQRIEIHCSGFFGGSMEFRAARDQLSVTQLDLLSRFALIEPKQGCPTDLQSCTLTITDAQGKVGAYGATEGDPPCLETASPAISFHSLFPFLQTLGCRYSKANFGATQDAAVLPDERCLNGLFTSSGPGTVTVRLDVEAPAVRHIEIDGCSGPNQIGKLTATLLLPPDTAPLATLAPVDASSSGADGACASLDYSFAQAGTYELDIAIAEGFIPVGDFFLKFY
jgi:hypothetical protein